MVSLIPEEFAVTYKFSRLFIEKATSEGLSQRDVDVLKNISQDIAKPVLRNEDNADSTILDADAIKLGIDPNLLRLGAGISAGGVTAREIGTAIVSLGTDNHAQAELVEQLFAKEIARHVDGEVIKGGSGVFTPDGGVDAVIKTADGRLKIQVKNFANAVGDATLKEYRDIVDVFASTNGFKNGAEPAAYGMDAFTKNDWSWASKAELYGNQFLHGVRQIFVGIYNALRPFAGHVRYISAHIVTKTTAAASWFIALSIGKQLAIIAAVLALAIAVYYVYKKYRGQNRDDSSTGVGTPSV
ncbi:MULTISPECIES: hypothetical protein [Haloferax]|uniref:Uncharacterized protein n=1 Tax=Haloferax marinum TaxID=2666143 RepID=A0A6A8GCK2_9EURY|nr:MULTISPECIES: hypothetical protein [Haloferax]KAB1190732.1 hypothetical protein Hfx1150_17010 [Haloferax sp. CBA1150]MRW98268.1 hypothetical protein [Haloferax marinum]